MGAYLGEEALELGIRVKTSSFIRNNTNSIPAKAKVNGGYVNSALAKMEALEAGYDEAVLLDANGFVAEGSGENIFWVRQNVIFTTPTPAVLAGITRDSVMTIARDLGYQVQETYTTRDELYTADEVWLCGTAAEITPVREVDGRRIGAGKCGPITKHLQKKFFSIVRGDDPAYNNWLAYV
jgi:branched-chain amino acid aminotransferase